MLAQNFMSHVELGISEAEQEALVTVLGMLERGELKHGGEPEGEAFNMGDTFTESHCGTLGCIGGYVAKFMGADRPGHQVYEAPGALKKLYFPREPSGRLLDCLQDITTSQAATALRSYLRTGEPNWADALRS